MSEIHPTALAGWGGRGAQDYEAGRPGYPPAAVTLIGEQLDVGRDGPAAILDLAAGSGKLTRELGVLGVEVIAVEPVAEMREQLVRAAPGARVLDGTAEAIPLPDGTVQAVTVAQAFHWFDVPRAAAEIVRVLAPGGGLAVLRNEWVREGWGEELRRYIAALHDRPETHTRDWASELARTGRFEDLAERVVPNDQRGDLDLLVRRVASMSFISALPDAQRAEVLDGARRLLSDRGLRSGEPVAIPTRTVVRWARRR